MKFPLSALALLTIAAPLCAQEAAVAPAAISAGTVGEVNKAVTTHVKASAKSLVAKDIDAYCREMGITLGAVTPKDAIYLMGIERVLVRADSPDFTRARATAYEMAYHRAVADYVMQKFGVESVRQFSTFFRDQSSDRLEPSADAQSTAQRIMEKTAKLAEAKLDEGLKAMGVAPTGSVAEKRRLAENTIFTRSMRNAVGSSAGLLPVQTFEGWNEANQYAVGVVIRGGAETETIAECLRRKLRPALVRPEAGCSVEKALPTDDEMVSQFGVRLFFDQQGVPALLSFGQWGSAYTGSDADEAEDAMDHALVQAEALANEQLTMFINSTITVKESSDHGGGKAVDALFDANGVPTEASVVKFVDRASKESTLQGRDTLIGRSTVAKKVLVHPANGKKLAVVVRMWSFGQYDAMTRIIEKPRPQTPTAVTPTVPGGTQGNRRGRSYDF